MGCCNNSERAENFESIKKQLYDAIQQGNLQKVILNVTRIKHLLPIGKADFDKLTFVFDSKKNIEINCLGLSLALGKLNIFKFFHQKLKADPLVMEEYFINSKITGLHIICSQNYIDLFEYYIETYLSISLKLQIYSPISSYASQDTHRLINIDFTPIQTACYLGNIPIVKLALDYCKKIDSVPNDLNLNQANEKTGENCALIACRGGKLNMIKFLHRNTNSDFLQHNNFNENALQILAASAKLHYIQDFQKSFVYLVEALNIDVTHNYQETLLLLDNITICDYFLKKLAEFQIFPDKKQIEQEIMSKPKRENETKYDTDKTFEFIKIFPDLFKSYSVDSHATIRNSFFSCSSN